MTHSFILFYTGFFTGNITVLIVKTKQGPSRCFFNNVFHEKIGPAVVRRHADFLELEFIKCFLCISTQTQTRRVIVTPHCSSSAVVAYHRLVPQVETSTVKMLPPSYSLIKTRGIVSEPLTTSLSRVPTPKYTVTNTNLMMKLELVCIVSTFVEPQHDRPAASFSMKMAFLHFLPVNAAGSICMTFQPTDQNADDCLSGFLNAC